MAQNFLSLEAAVENLKGLPVPAQIRPKDGNPSDFFYKALGLKIRDQTIVSFDPKVDVCNIKVQAPRGSIYGDRIFELSPMEVLAMIMNQTVRVCSTLPLYVYDYLVEVRESSQENRLKAAIEDLPNKFPQLDNVKYLSELTPSELSLKVVKENFFWPFLGVDGKILERIPGDHFFLRLITCSKLDLFDETKEKLGIEDLYMLIWNMAGCIYDCVTPDSVLVLPSFGQDVWGGEADFYWKAFLKAGKTMKFTIIIHSSIDSEIEVFSDYMRVFRESTNFKFVRSDIDIISYASLIKKSTGLDVYLLSVSPDDAFASKSGHELSYPELVGTYGLCKDWLCIPRKKSVLYVESRLTELEIQKSITPTRIILNGYFGHPIPTLSEGLVVLEIRSVGIKEVPKLPSTLKEFDCSDNELEHLPELPESLKILDCSDNKRLKLPLRLPSGLEFLYCSDTSTSKIDNLPAALKGLYVQRCKLNQILRLPPSLEELICSENTDLKSLPRLPETLLDLDCSMCDIKRLPKLPTKLINLDCSFNHLKVLQELPKSLKGLDCSANRISFPNGYKLPKKLRVFRCHGCELTNLPSLNKKLKTLICSLNQLQTLPKLHTNLLILDCEENKLTRLPKLRKRLVKLVCNGNELEELPELPKSLRTLECYRNRLTSVPKLPPFLLKLGCAANSITSLPDLPDSITEMEIGFNQITRLPRLPENLLKLVCSNNFLAELPELPEGLISLICNNNRLTSLPPLPNSLMEFVYHNNDLTGGPVRLPFSPESEKNRKPWNKFW